MSPRTTEGFKEIREESKNKIFNAAIELFAEKGFNATSINDIAKKAEVSKGLLYHYFKSKFGLLDEIVLGAFEEIDLLTETLFENATNPIDSIYNMLKLTMDSLQKKPEFWKLITGLNFKKQIKVRYKEQIEQRKVKYLETGYKLMQQLEVENPMLELLFIGALIDGMAFHYLEEPENYPVEQMLSVFRKKLETLYGNKNI